MLVESCKALNLNLHLYGQNEPWSGLIEGKVNRLFREIEKLDTEYVLITDSSDSFIIGHENDILDRYFKAGAPVLISAEKSCWPQSALAQYFPEAVSPWRFLNSGGYIGRKDNIVSLLHFMGTMPIDNSTYRSRDWEVDQFRFSLVYLDSQDSIKLDTKCELFQTMGDITYFTDGEYRDGRFKNLIHKTYPIVIHFNGHSDGMKDSFGYLSNIFSEVV